MESSLDRSDRASPLHHQTEETVEFELCAVWTVCLLNHILIHIMETWLKTDHFFKINLFFFIYIQVISI